ncbi:MAG: methyltransferase domain-containing protein [Candidatus Omnitrophica bacterium]|nr:methyltransferase domain-containing protein [Candidatus Omnitrophota bacterium]
MRKWLRKLRRVFLDSDPSFCDMHEDERARNAGEEYLRHIRRHLTAAFGQRRLNILDAGCQAGRLLIPLASDGHRLTGVDTSGFALRRARRHARQRSLAVRLFGGTIGRLRRWVAAESLDAVVCTEVLYLCQNYRRLLELLADSVKPGGLLCISHRPALYYAVAALRKGRPDQAAGILTCREGASPEGAYHNWQTREQLEELYASLGLAMRGCYAVDWSSWQFDLSGAPAAVREAMEECRSNGRFEVPAYLLIVAQKG